MTSKTYWLCFILPTRSNSTIFLYNIPQRLSLYVDYISDNITNVKNKWKSIKKSLICLIELSITTISYKLRSTNIFDVEVNIKAANKNATLKLASNEFVTYCCVRHQSCCVLGPESGLLAAKFNGPILKSLFLNQQPILLNQASS